MTDSETIYLDHAATTPLDPEVAAAMQPWLTQHFGNPSSIYGLGQESRAAVDRARSDVARVLGCQTAELIFTSGATEGDNLAVAGVAWAARLANPDGPAPHILTTAIEHSAVLETVSWLERLGFAATVVPCDSEGIVHPAAIEAALRPETCLVSVMYANNETGAVQPIAEIASLVRSRGIVFHTDAVQAAGLLPLRVDDLGVDLLTLSAHKFYGPKGVGVLYVRRGTPISYLQRGGGQESGRRGGTENVPGIVGLAFALQRAEAGRAEYVQYCAALRDRLVDRLMTMVEGVQLNGPIGPARRLPNNANLYFPGVQGEAVLLNLDMEGVAASAGSACTAGKSEPSHVLEAMGYDEARTRGSVRFTVGRTNTPEQIDEAAEIITEAVARVRALMPVG